MAIDYALCSVCQQNPSIFNTLPSLTSLSWNVARDKQTMETLARAAQSTPSLSSWFSPVYWPHWLKRSSISATACWYSQRTKFNLVLIPCSEYKVGLDAWQLIASSAKSRLHLNFRYTQLKKNEASWTGIWLVLSQWDGSITAKET